MSRCPVPVTASGGRPRLAAPVPLLVPALLTAPVPLLVPALVTAPVPLLAATPARNRTPPPRAPRAPRALPERRAAIRAGRRRRGST